jgi:hypothetical protein
MNLNLQSLLLKDQSRLKRKPRWHALMGARFYLFAQDPEMIIPATHPSMNYLPVSKSAGNFCSRCGVEQGCFYRFFRYGPKRINP